ncbi:MAG TPA: hypothetical protein VF116_16925 [Ktedonobacterales bacterium]
MRGDNVWRTLDDNNWGTVKRNWPQLLRLPLALLELPLRDPRPAYPGRYQQAYRWPGWILRWGWPVAALMLGAFIAPLSLELVGLANLSYSGVLEIAVALLVAILAQSADWLFAVLVFHVIRPMLERIDERSAGWWVNWLVGPVVALGFALPPLILPFVGVCYGIYRYVTWVGPGQHGVTVAFVGGLVVMMLVVPLVRRIVTSSLLKFIISRLRGDKAKPHEAWRASRR